MAKDIGDGSALDGKDLPSVFVNYSSVAVGPEIVRLAFAEILGTSLNPRAVVVMPVDRARQLAEIILSMTEKYSRSDIWAQKEAPTEAEK